MGFEPKPDQVCGGYSMVKNHQAERITRQERFYVTVLCHHDHTKTASTKQRLRAHCMLGSVTALAPMWQQASLTGGQTRVQRLCELSKGGSGEARPRIMPAWSMPTRQHDLRLLRAFPRSTSASTNSSSFDRNSTPSMTRDGSLLCFFENAYAPALNASRTASQSPVELGEPPGHISVLASKTPAP